MMWRMVRRMSYERICKRAVFKEYSMKLKFVALGIGLLLIAIFGVVEISTPSVPPLSPDAQKDSTTSPGENFSGDNGSMDTSTSPGAAVPPAATSENPPPSITPPYTTVRKYHPGHYVTIESGKNTDLTDAFITVLKKPGVVGLQVRYTWRELEISKGVYDFSKIQKHLDLLSKQDMKLVVFLEDKSFSGALPPPTPEYLQGTPYTLPNIPGGYSAVRWNPVVRAQFKAVVKELGKNFDGNPTLEGISFQESATGLTSSVMNANGYTPEIYRDTLIDTLQTAAINFPNSQVFWYMNFLTGHQSYIADIATAVAPYGVAMGGPDILPESASLKRLAYPFYGQFKGKITLFGSMQNDSYRELHAGTTNYWTMNEMFLFARDNLHVNYIFWNYKMWVTAGMPTGENKWTDALPVIKANPAFNTR